MSNKQSINDRSISYNPQSKGFNPTSTGSHGGKAAQESHKTASAVSSNIQQSVLGQKTASVASVASKQGGKAGAK
jgi:hypothetical protein